MYYRSKETIEERKGKEQKMFAAASIFAQALSCTEPANDAIDLHDRMELCRMLSLGSTVKAQGVACALTALQLY